MEARGWKKRPKKPKPRTVDDLVSDYNELRNIWRLDPVAYARQRIGLNPSKQQIEMLRAIAPPNSKVTARAGHGVGKSTCLAIIIWWHLECFDFCRIPCTAPTASQLRLVLWSELRKTLRLADEQAARTNLEASLYLSKIFTITQDRIAPGDVEWFAAARTARREQPDALQGFHNSNLTIDENDVAVDRDGGSGGALMFVIEEASGVPDEVFLPVEGALTSVGSRLIMVGNPTRNEGFFAKSHTVNRRDFTCLHFACRDSPLASPGYREGLVRRYGEGSNVVRVRADGDFPKQNDDTLISLEWAEAALTRDPIPRDHAARRVLGIDVARFGSDRTVFVVREGRQILHIEVHAKEDTMQTAGRALMCAITWQINDINVDVIGVGSGVVDRLSETTKDLQCTVNGITANDTATLRPKSRDKSANLTPEQRFGKLDMIPKSMKEYLWIECADWFHYEEPILVQPGCDWEDHAQTLVAEACTVRYSFSSDGKLVIESKDDVKKRLPDGGSPDIADALVLTFAPDRLSLWERLG